MIKSEKALILANSFCSKILLFGEYAIIKDGWGLAAPFSKFSGQLVQNEERADDSLFELLKYLEDTPLIAQDLQLDKFKRDLELGLDYKSNIPQGRGIGSSGALCASIFAAYSHSFKRKDQYESKELKLLQDFMALMESFYHGSSSGLDCLISLINKPVYIQGRKDVSVVNISRRENLGHFYLYDTGIKRKTSPLVHQVLDQIDNDPSFNSQFNIFIEQNNQTIRTFMGGDVEGFNENMIQLSKIERNLFQDLIPDDVKMLWDEGLADQKFSVKLCGAGGGGYFLIHSPELINKPQLIDLGHIFN